MARAALKPQDLESMRDRMTETALQIYDKEGLDAISFRRLADAMSLSTMLAYRYFENKDALLAHMRTRCLIEFDMHMVSRLTHRDSLELFIDAGLAYVEYVQRHPQHYLLMFSSHQPPPEQYPALLKVRQRLFDRMVGLTQACIDQGQIKGDARRKTHIGWACLHGLLTLQAANQLVYGCAIEELMQPLFESIFESHVPTTEILKRRAGKAAAKPRSRTRGV